jgi:hypothetical protein
MTVIALEERFVTPAVRDAWTKVDPAGHDAGLDLFDVSKRATRLKELTQRRLSLIDNYSVDVRVLS